MGFSGSWTPQALIALGYFLPSGTPGEKEIKKQTCPMQPTITVSSHILRCFFARYLVVDAPELPSPACVVEEGSEVVAVVVGAVALGVVGRRHRGHLVTIHRVHHKEALHLLRHLTQQHIATLR